MPSSPLWYEHHPSGSAPSEALLLDYCRLPSHLGKSSKLICTRFGVSYLDILDFGFLKYHNVILIQYIVRRQAPIIIIREKYIIVAFIITHCLYSPAYAIIGV